MNLSHYTRAAIVLMCHCTNKGVNRMRNIERYFRVIDRSLFFIDGTLDYDRLTAAITTLATLVHEFDGDTDESESMWYIGEYGNCCLSDLIVGAFWHYTEWHGGQWSTGYAALSALGQVFSPGMTCGPEPDSCEYDVYVQMNDMAEKAQAA